jgi:uncharacterized membrane protein
MIEAERDIQRLWNGQPREEHVMSIDDVRSKAERFERTLRRRSLATAALVALVIIVEAWQVWRTPELLERVGDLLTIAAFVYVGYRFRGYATAQMMPAGLGLTSSIDFYRTQLARQRDLASHPWRYYAVFIPGVALSLLSGALDQSPALTAAFAAFGIILFVATAWWTRRGARRLQDEIDELG